MKSALTKRLSLVAFNLFSGTFSRWKWIQKVKKWLLKCAGIHIGANTTVVGPIECTGTLTVGDNTWIGKNFKVNGNGQVTIGSNVDIGPEVTFQTGTHEIGTGVRRAGKGYNCAQSVGNGTWIGCRVTVINETAIGESCIIAAGAVVTKNIESNTMVGGMPAKTIKTLPPPPYKRHIMTKGHRIRYESFIHYKHRLPLPC